ncbi:MAG: hypothetical protein KDI19_05415 [Pseudomonadales bacterium]|nr:hypothetical protein [Pseudomonadales bacterium]
MTDAPWFEDFEVGNEYSDVPSVTLTEGHAAIHQAIFGDRLPLTLDRPLCRRVTGEDRLLANPSMVCNFAIGQTTIPSQRVMGNLFYRGLVLRQPVFIGDTLTTRTKVVALRQNKAREGRAASGMVALEMHVTNQAGDTVLFFWRCPMIPCRDPAAQTGRNDDFDMMPSEVSLDALRAAVPRWQVDPAPAIGNGDRMRVEARDTVTLAPELVRLTGNLAMTHTDAARSVYGKRLVYGGHTISIAAAQLSRAVPGMVTILGWYHCDHVAPVFEEDILRSEVILESIHEAGPGTIGVVHVETFADRGPESPAAASGNDIKVLDWRLAILMALDGENPK